MFRKLALKQARAHHAVMMKDNEPLELLSVAQMGEADALAIAGGIAGIDLMEAAGRAVADAARRANEAAGGGSIVVLCGPGNNAAMASSPRAYLRIRARTSRSFCWDQSHA